MYCKYTQRENIHEKDVVCCRTGCNYGQAFPEGKNLRNKKIKHIDADQSYVLSYT